VSNESTGIFAVILQMGYHVIMATLTKKLNPLVNLAVARSSKAYWEAHMQAWKNLKGALTKKQGQEFLRFINKSRKEQG
jgi:hypothetical protein